MITTTATLNTSPIAASIELSTVTIAQAISAVDTLNGEEITGTLLTKMAELAATKAAIKAAIIAQGVDIPEDTLFSDYASYIAQIGV